MSEPALADLLARLDAIDAKLAVIAIPATALVPRVSYSAREFAAMAGISYRTICRPRYWRRIGGKKVGGRIIFSEAVRLAIAEGKK